MTCTLIGVMEHASADPHEILVALNLDGATTNVMLRNHAALKARLVAAPAMLPVIEDGECVGETPNPARAAIEADVLAEVTAIDGRETTKRAADLAASEAENVASEATARAAGVAQRAKIRAARQRLMAGRAQRRQS